MPLRRRLLSAAIALAGICGLSACSSTVALEPAENANDPLCAAASVILPESIGALPRRWTDAQATAAWGEPAAVIFTCGLTPPQPTTLPCSEVDGVDWIIDDAQAPRYRFTTYGREPAVEVFLDYDVIGSAEVLRAVAPAVRRLAEVGGCTDLSETQRVPAAPDPADRTVAP